MDKKSRMMKDAIILCAITLILGAVLAGVYMLTKDPIDNAQKKTNNEACAVVVAQGDSVKDNDAEAVSGAAAYLGKHDLSNAEVKEGDLLSEYVEITEVHPTANGGKVYLANALKGYGGKISFALGVDAQSAITGIQITSESETAGLGANCENDEFKARFKGIKAPESTSEEMYNKNETTDTQVQALSCSMMHPERRLVSMSKNVCGERLINGIVKENPTFVMMLGMCPTLAVTSSAMNGLGMGLSTTVVLILSNMLISALRKIIPDKVRIPAFIVIVASFVTIVQLLLQAYIPFLYSALGVYIPLIVVNCIILGRAEAYASKNPVIASAFDGMGMGLGFTMGLTLIGIFREILGSGSIFGFTILPSAVNISIFVMAPGAFFVLAGLTALQNKLKMPSATNKEEEDEEEKEVENA